MLGYDSLPQQKKFRDDIGIRVRTSREVQRIEGILRSPVNTCYTEAITGRTTIDAYKIQVKAIGVRDFSPIYKYLGLHD